MAHAAVREKRISKEQMSVDHGSPSFRKGRGSDAETTMQFIHQRLDHRADVAGRGGVEGGTDFEIDLPGALLLQPAAGTQRLLHCRGGGHGARLERYHDGIGVQVFIVRGDVHG